MTKRDLERDPVRRWVGHALAATGLITMATAGLCSLGLLGSALSGMPNRWLEVLATNAMMAAIFGGVPALAGWSVWRWGQSLRRPEPLRRSQPVTDFTSLEGGADDGAT